MTAGKVPSDQEVLFSIELLTISQVAEWARVSTKTIYRWIESGKILVAVQGLVYNLSSPKSGDLYNRCYIGKSSYPIFRDGFFRSSDLENWHFPGDLSLVPSYNHTYK
ncbi:MAG: helix-turn-helix domain-containing protein [Chloroflexi bacterium]|nr:helix-turn-helix domain-containing protein [Chloroflexota bacterium]